MSPILELEEAVALRDAPRLLVEWSSPWREFLGSIRPALKRSEARLAGEAPFGLIPLRIMIPSYVVETFLILAVIFVKVKIDQLRPVVLPVAASGHDVIYYSGDELPRTEDLGGAEAGTAGRAGGEEAHHRTQTIKIARGGSLVPEVVDAPNLKLPSSRDAVANLLAIKPDPGPPPSEGMRSTRAVPNLGATLVAPSPDVIRDYTRNGVKLDAVAPPSSLTRDRPLTAPNLSSTLVAPAPNVASDHTLVAPALAPIVVPPSATVKRDRTPVAPSLETSVVAPAPNVSRDPFRAAPTLSGNVVAPATETLSRQVSAAPVHNMEARVVPPPVSAPERTGANQSKLSLPAPAVVAPPPSSNITADVRRLANGNAPDLSKTVVPPPTANSSGGSLMSSLIGRIFGPTEVAPPPPSTDVKATGGASAPTLAPHVVAPPTTSIASDAVGSPRGNRNGLGPATGGSVVAPPPSTGLSEGSGSSRASAPYLGNPSVIAPPPALAGNGGGTGNSGGAAGTSGGRMLAENIVPPPPSVSGGSSVSGSGLGRRGTGLGAPLDAGSGPTPPNNGGSGRDAGTVISSQPGTKLGVPISGSTGSLAMSPSGRDKAGLGGGAEGQSIGHGDGSGSGMSGSGSGAAKSGAGHGSDSNAHGGISPSTGPGGAGTVSSGNPPIRGVDISGGSNIITIPGFGSDPAANDPSAPHTSQRAKQQPLGVTVVATASSAGAFEPYKNLLRGEKYITYLDTSAGTVVMEFADESGAGHNFGGTLSAPVPMRIDLPDGLPRARMVVTCRLDASGNLSNFRVLEAGPASMTAKVLAALRTWKFQSATRNNQPVEVTTILGFGIDTNDRF